MSTVPERKEIETWFKRQSTRLLKRNNIASDTKPLSPTDREKMAISGLEAVRLKIPMMSTDHDRYFWNQ